PGQPAPGGTPAPEGPPPPGGWPPPGAWGPPGSVPPPGWQYPYPVPMPAPRPYGMPLAASGARLVARLIDIFVVLILNVLVNGWFIYEYVQEVAPAYREWSRRVMQGDGSAVPEVTERAANLQIVIVLLAAALWFAYEVPAVANTGQTLGKRLLGIRVIRLDNPQRLGFGRSFRRWNTMGLPTLLWCCGIGFVLQLIDALFVPFDRPLHQALHDKSALTVVVHVRPPASPASGAPGGADQAENPPGGTP
ncbi:MAG: RDD family protein, partial [Micromonosporaceae bacterium]|nr:RDD family protein [Micromonosporaceae bacterium]